MVGFGGVITGQEIGWHRQQSQNSKDATWYCGSWHIDVHLDGVFLHVRRASESHFRADTRIPVTIAPLCPLFGLSAVIEFSQGMKYWMFLLESTILTNSKFWAQEREGAMVANSFWYINKGEHYGKEYHIFYRDKRGKINQSFPRAANFQRAEALR